MQSDRRDKEFAEWMVGFQTQARAHGISESTLTQAFERVGFDDDVALKDRTQPEFMQPIWTYLDRAVSNQRITSGRKLLEDHSGILSAIEAKYEVDRRILVSIWGLESNFGNTRGDKKVVQSLASLAFDGRRQGLFEKQLIAALEILQSGDIAPREMVGSWAGAMGHTQFMPTSYLEHAVDFDGDGARNIWWDDPVDALASTGNYLAEHGWKNGELWGAEVTLPADFDYRLTSRATKLAVGDWVSRGVILAASVDISMTELSSIVLPAGCQGPAILALENFDVLLEYNASDAYVFAVGLLCDALAGSDGLKAEWPRGDRPLTIAEIKSLQQRLTESGFDTMGADGLLGPNTTAAMAAFQNSINLPQDGYASYALLQKLLDIQTSRGLQS